MSLPSGYSELEYIESTGTQYINLGEGSSMGFILDCKFTPTLLTSSTGAQPLIGSHNSAEPWGRNYFCISYTDAQLGQGDVIHPWSALTQGDTYIVSCSNIATNTYCTINGQTMAMQTPYTGALSSNDMYLLYCNVGTWFMPFIGKIYYANITFGTSGDSMILLPCMRKSDGKIGMYDTIGNTFYGNAGTGEFTSGPIVSTSAIYVKVNGAWKQIDGVTVNVN